MVTFQPNPPEYSDSDRILAENSYSSLLQDTMLLGGKAAQFRAGKEVLPMIGIRQSDTRCKIKTVGTTPVYLGDLDAVCRAASDSGDGAVRIRIRDLTTDEVLTILYDCSANTISAAEDQVLNTEDGDRASGNDTLVITAENSNGQSGGDPTGEIVVSVEDLGTADDGIVDHNLVITPGSAISGERFYEISRLSDKAANELFNNERQDSNTTAELQALLGKYAIGGNYGSFVGTDPYDPPDGPVGGAWIGWVLNMILDNISAVYDEVIPIPQGHIAEQIVAPPPGTNRIGMHVLRQDNSSGVVVVPGNTNNALTKSSSVNEILGKVFDYWGSFDVEAAAKAVRGAIYADAPLTYDDIVGGVGLVYTLGGNIAGCGASVAPNPVCQSSDPICGFQWAGRQPRNVRIEWDGNKSTKGWYMYACIDPCSLGPGGEGCQCLDGCTPVRIAIYQGNGVWGQAYEANPST